MSAPVPDAEVLRALVDRAFDDATREPRVGRAEHLLLADFLACVEGGGEAAAPRGWRNDGTAGCAAALAVRAHARDQDDIHWLTGIHPGSVIWPVAIAVGAEVAADGFAVATAARVGYDCMAALARLLGPAHARLWHATSTCGAFGAAASAAVLLDLSADQRVWACGHAVAVAGGVGQAVVEHSPTTGFHRAAAVVAGIQAARLAHAGVPSSKSVLDGEQGVFALFRAAPAAGFVIVRTAATLGTTSVRLYPVNGLAQAAVEITAGLRQRSHSEVTSLVVEVSDSVAEATTGVHGGVWWDLRHAVAAAWSTGSPFELDQTPDSAFVRNLVRVVTGTVGRGTTRVTARTPRGDLHAQADSPLGFLLNDPRLAPQLDLKWDRLVGADRGGARQVRESAAALFSRGPRPSDVEGLLDSSNAI